MLYEAPGGNLVDGLPPVASTGAGSQAGQAVQKKISGKATFDELVLRIPLVDRDEILHAGFYRHELAYRINGMSVTCLRTEDTPERSIFFGQFFGDAG